MKAVIVGCGRVGAYLAESLDAAGHDVVIVDTSTAAFDRLPPTFKGSAVRGDGTDEDVLRRAGSDGADLFLALTEGDNRNVMACQLAAEELGARQVIAKINDPVRADAYAALGVATLCRTNLMVEAVLGAVGLPSQGLVGLLAPTGSHPGGEHHEPAPVEPMAAGPAAQVGQTRVGQVPDVGSGGGPGAPGLGGPAGRTGEG